MINIKKNLILFFLITISLFLVIINIKNPIKTKFYLFTSQTEKITLGNLITFAFISGYTCSSFLTFISSKNYIDNKNNLNNEEDFNVFKEDSSNKEFKLDRPPERDVRDSQPTISVNYRYVDSDNDSYSSKNPQKRDKNIDNSNNDWLDTQNDW